MHTSLEQMSWRYSDKWFYGFRDVTRRIRRVECGGIVAARYFTALFINTVWIHVQCRATAALWPVTRAYRGLFMVCLSVSVCGGGAYFYVAVLWLDDSMHVNILSVKTWLCDDKKIDCDIFERFRKWTPFCDRWIDVSVAFIYQSRV